MQGIGGGLVLLYYIKKSIDGFYKIKEAKLIGDENKHHN